MTRLFFLLIILFPTASIAATDCQYIEYQDRFEAVCIGEPSIGKGLATSGTNYHSVSESFNRPVETNDVQRKHEKRMASQLAGLHPSVRRISHRPEKAAMDRARAERLGFITAMRQAEQGE